MPVRIGFSRYDHDQHTSTDSLEAASPHLSIGLLNNMPDAAFKATQRQFVSLLNAASDGIAIHLSLYSMSDPSKAESNGHSDYANIETLRGTRLDGLIVTGREPIMPDLRDEPYWSSFVQVVEWAQHNTHSTIWSCLAAHAAVLHLDDIPRRRSNNKHCGIFECALVSRHGLTEGIPSRFYIPHSRWNGIAEAELAARGYEVLARAGDEEIDMFIKQGESLFLFFQGHPEYEFDTLLREYRRDVERYLGYQLNVYPSTPSNYFDPAIEDALDALRKQAISSRNPDLSAGLATVLEKNGLTDTWRPAAAGIYRNWLEYLCTRRSASQIDPLAHTQYPMSR